MASPSPAPRICALSFALLLEGAEDAVDGLGFDTDAAVVNLNDATIVSSCGANPDTAARRRELYGVLDQVPDNLLQTAWVAIDRVRGILQAHGKMLAAAP